MAVLFVVFGMIALVVGIFGSLVGSGTSGLGAIGASAVCILIAIYARAGDDTKALLSKLSEVTSRLDQAEAAATKRAARPTPLLD